MAHSAVPVRTSSDSNSSADINQLASGIPEWISTRTYSEDGFVTYQGSLYRSTQDSNLNNTPGTGSEWVEFVGGGGGGGAGTIMQHLRTVSAQTFINGNNDFQVYESTLAEAVAETNEIAIILAQEGTLTTLETFLNTITSIVVDTVNTFNSGNEVTLSLSDIYDTTENEFLLADYSSLGWDGNSDLWVRIVCNTETETISSEIWLDKRNTFSTLLNALPNYDTGWINRSDWTNVHMGSTTTKNVDSNVTHNFNTTLDNILVMVFTSTDGTAANAVLLETNADADGASKFGVGVFYINDNEIKVQTGSAGLIQMTDVGGHSVINTQDWYYKVIVYKMR